MSRERETSPQTSPEPASTSAGVSVPKPSASSCTVTSWQSACGATLSTTVANAEQLLSLPLGSVTVRMTGLDPISSQSKLVTSIAKRSALQLSVEPASTSVAVRLPRPSAFSCTVTSWQLAMGAMTSITVTMAVQVSLLLFSSSTVRVTRLVPRSPQSNIS